MFVDHSEAMKAAAVCRAHQAGERDEQVVQRQEDSSPRKDMSYFTWASMLSTI